jgi:hypothetical protein
MLSFVFAGETLVAVCGISYPSVVLDQQKEPMDSQCNGIRKECKKS